jgi:nitrite reductase/ring-hydroxylating ferredoxin subunit
MPDVTTIDGWITVGKTIDLPPGTRRIVSAGRFGIGVFNVGGQFYALNNYCPHMGAPLCKGPITATAVADSPYQAALVRDGEILRCPWHGWEFDIETGRTLTSPTRRTKTFRVIVQDGLIKVKMSAARTDSEVDEI